ncbi:hypothetical protein G6L37_11910 [Agrobacterium rubi]|uniref:hypothetical protein n=1 Tax=Agrobacterium rubi TaxID=28099 RepID=UPI001571C1A7|nr:hypothetical protein [Agrobacterium rubi]NTF06867.1 hypothetical protein [Agrobacterium rubi]NTF19109.1 hypothetical protein [Agrobacterium rubi]NTF26072.1 hypothetical protein [Agrobacterium rubi]
MTTTQEIIDRADKAKRLRENEDFIAITEAVKADLFRQFCTTNVLNTEAREELHKISYAIALMRRKIDDYITSETLRKIEDETE